MPQHKDDKKATALARQAAHDKLTPAEKLARLDLFQHRAVKERARLQKQIDAA